jgi:hypothetical protein
MPGERRRPAKFDWWRSDWNPVDWNAEEWFKTHDHAPWVEHTLALIEEGWDKLTVEPPPRKPIRVRAPPPEPLTMWEIYVRKQVDKRYAWEAEESLRKWAAVGHWTRQHHRQDHDIRTLERQQDVPNYRPRSEWSEQEIVDLIACPPEAHRGLTVLDPDFKVSPRGLRPVGLNELDALRAVGRLRETGPSRRAAHEVTLAQMLGLDPIADKTEAAAAAAADEPEAADEVWEEEADELMEATEDELSMVRDVGDDF